MYKSGSPSIMREAGISSYPELIFLLRDFRMLTISLADIRLKIKRLCATFSFSVKFILLWYFQTELIVEINGIEDLILLLISAKNLQKPFAHFLLSVV